MTDDGAATLGQQIAELPKISLHDHLDGGLRPATILELARERGVTLPVTDETDLIRWVAERADSGTLVRYLEVDELNLAVLQDAAALERVARERVVDLAAENVIYAELRWAPEETTARGLRMQSAVEAVQRGIREGISLAESAGKSIRVGQLLSGLRHTTRSIEVARLAVENRDREGVVGFDIAGPELGYSLRPHREAFDLASSNLLPVTVHAGEADGVESIREALDIGRAIRIGHGVRIIDDISLGEDLTQFTDAKLGHVASWIRDRGIHLEICLTSNLQTDAISTTRSSPRDHPLALLGELGFSVSINPDNVLTSATSVTSELVRATATFGLGIEAVRQAQRNAALAAFAPLPERATMARAIDRAAGSADE